MSIVLHRQGHTPFCSLSALSSRHFTINCSFPSELVYQPPSTYTVEGKANTSTSFTSDAEPLSASLQPLWTETLL